MENIRENYWKTSNTKEFEDWYNHNHVKTCELDQIGQKFNCDKSNTQVCSKTWKNTSLDIDLIIPGHNYTQIYEQELKHLQNEEINILEFGIGNYPTNGYSMRMWLEYFPKAHITLLDWSTDNFRFDFEFDTTRVDFYRVDQSRYNDLKEFSLNCGKKFDVIIDDCSHQSDMQFETLTIFFDSILNQSGYYFIEDIHDVRFRDYLPTIFDSINTGNFFYESPTGEVIKNLNEIRIWRSLMLFKKGEKITR